MYTLSFILLAFQLVYCCVLVVLLLYILINSKRMELFSIITMNSIPDTSLFEELFEECTVSLLSCAVLLCFSLPSISILDSKVATGTDDGIRNGLSIGIPLLFIIIALSYYAKRQNTSK